MTNLAFLGDGGGKRRLPDPAQGQLIAKMQEQLTKETQQRQALVQELKAEKQLRWKVEEDLKTLEKKAAQLRDLTTAQKHDLDTMTAECENERAFRAEAEAQAAQRDRTVKQLTAQLAKAEAAKTEAETHAQQGVLMMCL